MSLILVVEQEARYIERIHDALAGEGWRVKVVNGAEAALQAAAAEAPQLVLVNSEAQGATHLLESFARRRGGPGSVAMVPERSGAAGEVGADEVLVKPFTDKDLRLLVRRALGAARESRPVPGRDGRQLTSQEIFGDVLAEVEGREGGPEARRPAPVPVKARVPDARDEIERKLEETLSGVLGVDKPRAKEAKAARAASSASVDELISRTLSGLDLPKPRTAARQSAEAQSPPPVAGGAPPEGPAAAPEEADVSPAAAASLDAVTLQKPPALDEPPALLAPAAAPPLPEAGPPPSAGTPGGVSGLRRSTGEIDLAQLDELARPRPPAPRREPPPLPADLGMGEDLLRTQRVPILRPGVPPAVGREFGQYTLLDRIAVGGMAEVWKARMKGVEGFQKTVAIKKILPHLTDSADFVTMFIDEAKLAAQLNHQNIIHIYDLGKIGDDYYIAMEYVEGKDLRSILNAARRAEPGGQLPLGLALFVAARLAAALDHAHRQRDFEDRELDLVHRDVSPQNVLISYEGDIKLCDFGIVKAVSKASQTQMGALKGKLQYMSPEQAWGKPVDARSDIFSLGSLLFEMLTGRRLFAGDSEISVLEAVRDCRIQRPRELVPSLPEDLDRLVSRALAREPGQRFTSAGEMQKELERLLHALRPTPGQADLAVYMQRLFGAEARAQTAAAAAEPGTAAALATGGAEGSAAGVKASPAAVVAPAPGARVEEGEGRGKGLLVAAIAAAVVAAVGLYFVLGRTGTPQPEPAPPAVVEGDAEPEAQVPEAPAPEGAADAPSPEAAPAPPPPASPTPAAPTAPPVDVAKLVDEQLARREQELRQQFEASRRRLEQEIAKVGEASETPAASPPTTETRRPGREPQTTDERPADAGADWRAAEAPRPAAPESAAPEPAAPPVSDPKPEPTAPAQAPPGAAPPAAAPASEAPATEPGPATETGAPATSAPVPPPAPGAGVPDAGATSTTAAPPPPVPVAAPPPRPAVRRGELATPGRGVIPPALVSVNRPSYPPLAQRQRIEGEVTVEVLIDENGNVVETRIVKRVPQDVGFNEAAEVAARTAKFKPATKEGVEVRMWFTLTFPFRL